MGSSRSTQRGQPGRAVREPLKGWPPSGQSRSRHLSRPGRSPRGNSRPGPTPLDSRARSRQDPVTAACTCACSTHRHPMGHPPTARIIFFSFCANAQCHSCSCWWDSSCDRLKAADTTANQPLGSNHCATAGPGASCPGDSCGRRRSAQDASHPATAETRAALAAAVLESRCALGLHRQLG
jgi:hypothetical protein